MVHLDLEKSTKVVLDEMKKLDIVGLQLNVKLMLDYSGSMIQLYQRGVMQSVVERVLPIALAMGLKPVVECYIFHDQAYKVPVDITEQNLKGFVDREILNSRRYTFGGTNYAPAIDLLLNDHLKGAQPVEAEQKKGGFFSNIFKKAVPAQPTTQSDVATLVLFQTDGDAMDRLATERSLIKASHHAMFIQTIGVGGANFSFLKRMDKMEGRFIDNAGFFEIETEEIETVSDQEIYSRMLSELPSYLKLAKANNLIA